ncbi:hypothetical protein AMAG_15185 [Allomyces macrogynus ATCC 38327]|uniref:Glucosidase II subunit alpha n=1 Tax=Allomyces macrogynus (strain ATCC 38327) TaxID=578462 RepID=A0A0L0T6A3_ALLM3|nr:hypothetical protein AMAG_15185 [Allomyces macrogynus ATCC 38327]|eukprot:KNE70216.1 hypothetical protein AMAG_15185 [Allomyces macrogynus ATCC 38327]
MRNCRQDLTMPRRSATRCRARAVGRVLATLAIVAAILAVILPVSNNSAAVAVKAEEFKICAQSGFCRRHRAWADLRNAFDPNSATPIDVPKWTHATIVAADTNHAKKGEFRARLRTHVAAHAGQAAGNVDLAITTLARGMVRVQVRDASLDKVFDVPAVALVKPTPDVVPHQVVSRDGGATLVVEGGVEVRVQYAPLRIEVVRGGDVLAVVNDRALFRFETGATIPVPAKKKEENKVPEVVEGGAQPAQEDLAASSAAAVAEDPELKWIQIDHDGAHEEEFRSHKDTKPNGPRSFGFDVTFPETAHAYGLAEHAADFNLPSTRGPGAKYADPYRLYNLDVFEYNLDSPMALYGSVPLVITQGDMGSAGVLVMTASEMWVDVARPVENQLATHWMTESSPLDVIFMTGANAAAVHGEYLALSGFPTLPPLFAMAYHQCRWNYNDEADVRAVDAKFDEHEIPYDVLWLDIEHTDGKRYFTWDKVKFPTPDKMLDNLATKHRKMVTIIDPHIKEDSEYRVSAEATKQGLLVKNAEGTGDFGGWCWPGQSNWIDFTDPKARAWWAAQFAFDQYLGSTPTLFTWNDMNEPSVFTGPEITMPKTVQHHGGLEHRIVHNAYGMLQHRATHEGHLHRLANQARPFVLSRAFFIGSQRYGAIWTGDNLAEWSHLEAAQPMLLSLTASGIVFGGADVGGFFGNPDTELLVRWYQAAAFQPFFRAHAHIDTKRREPWLFDDLTTRRIRDAVRRRYRYLPTVATAFWDAWAQGTPVMQPLAWAFPEDKATWSIQDTFLVGKSGVLVAPVTAAGATTRDVYLPGKSNVWYALGDASFALLAGGKTCTVAAPLDEIPLFLRGGSVLVTRDRLRRSAEPMLTDPVTVTVALDAGGRAEGHFVVEDGASFAYLDGAVVDVAMRMSGGEFRANVAVPSTTRDADAPAELVSQKRTIAVNETAHAKFMARFGDVRVERLVVVAPSAFERGTVAEVLDKDSNIVKRVPVESQLGGRMVVVKEPGFHLRDAAWTLRLVKA